MNLYSACSLVSALNVFVHFALHEKKNSKNLKSPGEMWVPVIGLLKKKGHDFSCNVNARAICPLLHEQNFLDKCLWQVFYHQI